MLQPQKLVTRSERLLLTMGVLYVIILYTWYLYLSVCLLSFPSFLGKVASYCMVFVRSIPESVCEVFFVKVLVFMIFMSIASTSLCLNLRMSSFSFPCKNNRKVRHDMRWRWQDRTCKGMTCGWQKSLPQIFTKKSTLPFSTDSMPKWQRRRPWKNLPFQDRSSRHNKWW